MSDRAPLKDIDFYGTSFKGVSPIGRSSKELEAIAALAFLHKDYDSAVIGLELAILLNPINPKETHVILASIYHQLHIDDQEIIGPNQRIPRHMSKRPVEVVHDIQEYRRLVGKEEDFERVNAILRSSGYLSFWKAAYGDWSAIKNYDDLPDSGKAIFHLSKSVSLEGTLTEKARELRAKMMFYYSVMHLGHPFTYLPLEMQKQRQTLHSPSFWEKISNVSLTKILKNF